MASPEVVAARIAHNIAIAHATTGQRAFSLFINAFGEPTRCTFREWELPDA